MAFAFDEIFAYGGQLIVAAKKRVPKALGIGEEKIDHSAYIEGNTQIGKVDAFSDATATLMVGREDTIGTNRSLYIRGNTIMEGDSGTPFTLNVNGDVTIVGNTKQTGNTVQTGTIKASGTITASNFVGSVGTASGKSSGAKAFDIPHPSKEGYRLRHICVEGPESAVYYRGRTNKNTIPLPLYWKDLIDPASLTVTLTPIGAHQNIIVKRWDSEFIYLQGQGGGPVNCFYHVYAERKDVNPLLTEYEGNSRYDYPDPNFSEKSDIPIEERNYTDPNYKFPRNTYTV